MRPTSITSINKLPEEERREIYARLIPKELLEHFQLGKSLHDNNGKDLLELKAAEGGNTVEMSLFHADGFRDPVLYGHLTDTLNDQIHVLLYIMNDPESPRYDVDVMPDGTPTMFGTAQRNLEAEKVAMEAGLSPGQIRKGLRMASKGLAGFESFVASLGHSLYFIEPLYYHNAIIFERYGFKYQSGRRRMERIHGGFSAGGEFEEQLDGNDFRKREAANSIRLRSWAIHDGIMGEAFTDVTMYKIIGKHAGMNTSGDTAW